MKLQKSFPQMFNLFFSSYLGQDVDRPQWEGIVEYNLWLYLFWKRFL